MCGIAGIVHTDTRPVSPDTLQAMADALAGRAFVKQQRAGGYALQVHALLQHL